MMICLRRLFRNLCRNLGLRRLMMMGMVRMMARLFWFINGGVVISTQLSLYKGITARAVLSLIGGKCGKCTGMLLCKLLCR